MSGEPTGAVTPDEFWSWPVSRQREYLRGASGRKAEAVGVGAICGTCGEPMRMGIWSHQCDPAQLAELMAELADRKRVTGSLPKVRDLRIHTFHTYIGPPHIHRRTSDTYKPRTSIARDLRS